MGGKAFQARVVRVGVDEFAVPQSLLDDGEDHGEHQGEVGTRFGLQHLVGGGSKMEVERVDADEACASVVRIVDFPKGWRDAEGWLLSPEDEQVGVVVVAVGRHAAVGDALHHRAWNEAFRCAHTHIGSHGVGESLCDVVGESPPGRLAANEAD